MIKQFLKNIIKLSSLCLFLLSRTFIFLISGLRPILGAATCKYPVTCTRYALAQLNDQPLPTALYSIIKRIISCNPFW